MTSVFRQPPCFLRPLPGVECKFVDANEIVRPGDSTPTKLLELLVPPNAPEAPQPHLRASDGYFHTGDLFERTDDRLYIFRGRDDDWIKDEATKRCDTKYFLIFHFVVCFLT